MKIKIDDQLYSVYPDIRLGLLQFQADVKESDKNFWECMNHTVLPQVQKTIEGKQWNEIPGVKGSRSAYKAFGRNP